MSGRRLQLQAVLVVLAAAFMAAESGATTIYSFSHVFAYGADPTAVKIDLLVTDAVPGRYLWEYTVTNNSYDPAPGTSNGFSGFELFLPSPIPEIADISPNPASVPPWDIDCCSGNPVEWDIRDTVGLGVMPGASMVFSFTTDPRAVAINDSGWFHSWIDDVQVEIVPTEGMHVPWVPGLTPIPEPGSVILLALGLVGLAASRRRTA